MRTEILAIVAIVVASLTRALKEDLPAFHSWAPKWRALLTGGLGIASGVVDMVVAGSDWQTSAMTVLKTALPSFVLLLVEAVLGGGDGGGSASKVASATSLKPGAPAGPYSAKMVKGPWSRAWVGAMTLCLIGAVGCINPGQIPQWIQQAMVIMQNMTSIVNALRDASDLFMQTAPVSNEVKKSVQQAFLDLSMAESAVTDLLDASQDVTQGQLDSARDKVLAAYKNLTALLGKIGAIDEVATGTVRATRGSTTRFLTPMLVRERLVK